MMKLFKKMMFAFAAVSMLAFAGCEKEPNVVPVNPGDDPTDTTTPVDPPTELTSMAGTSWIGIYDDSYQGYPAELTWNVDFGETDGSLYLELKVNGEDQQPQTMNFTYTYSNHRILCTLSNGGQFTMTYHPEENILTGDFVLSVDGTTLGGPTNFYPRGTNPIPHSGDNGGGGTGEVTNEFPAGTNWTAGEQVTYDYQGTPLPVDIDYRLNFNNTHGGSVVITLTSQGQQLGGNNYNITWTYDEASAQGTIVLQGNSIPFHYNAANDKISVSFPFGADGIGSFGQNLEFSR